MKKFLLFFITAISFFSAKAEINIWGSAVYLTVNGTAAFYNTRQLTPPYAIGDLPFQNNLGVFGKNSGNLKITGAEINISSIPNNVAVAKVFYLIYKHGERPSAPVFTSFPLQAYCKCNGSSFGTCGGKACDDIHDQKFQTVNQSIDLTGLETGTYTIELYFAANSPNEQVVDDNSTNNYKADFIITAPLPVNIISLRGSAGDEDIVIRWETENDINITRYEVEKSLNGLSFVPLQSIISFQNPSVSNYYLDDNAPVIGTNYYRIKSYNTNGAVAVSNVFRIYYGKVGNTVLIYPNPVDGELVVRLAGIQKGDYGISVLGTNGQILITRSLYHDGQDKTIRINLPVGMQRGVYRLFLIDKYKFYKQSFMVK